MECSVVFFHGIWCHWSFCVSRGSIGCLGSRPLRTHLPQVIVIFTCSHRLWAYPHFEAPLHPRHQILMILMVDVVHRIGLNVFLEICPLPLAHTISFRTPSPTFEHPSPSPAHAHSHTHIRIVALSCASAARSSPTCTPSAASTLAWPCPSSSGSSSSSAAARSFSTLRNHLFWAAVRCSQEIVGCVDKAHLVFVNRE